jgi:hypothetical protein
MVYKTVENRSVFTVYCKTGPARFWKPIGFWKKPKLFTVANGFQLVFVGFENRQVSGFVIHGPGFSRLR